MYIFLEFLYMSHMLGHLSFANILNKYILVYIISCSEGNEGIHYKMGGHCMRHGFISIVAASTWAL